MLTSEQREQRELNARKRVIWKLGDCPRRAAELTQAERQQLRTLERAGYLWAAPPDFVWTLAESVVMDGINGVMPDEIWKGR